jgi:hypothetical protein
MSVCTVQSIQFNAIMSLEIRREACLILGLLGSMEGHPKVKPRDALRHGASGVKLRINQVL